MIKHKNIILVGMAGAGKSTLGVLAAKALGMNFVDTDIIIQNTTGFLLQEILEAQGIAAFLQVEEDILSQVTIKNSIVATGGSAVYSEKAMAILKNQGTVLYLSLPFDDIQKRVTNIESRGIVLKQGNNLEDAFKERLPLYEKYADITLDCHGKDIETCVNEIVSIARNNGEPQ